MFSFSRYIYSNCTEVKIKLKSNRKLRSRLKVIKFADYLHFRCFTADAEKKMLVLEDMRAQQFRIVDSCVGLDTDHLKLALLTLAKWHAGTATLLLTVRKFNFQCIQSKFLIACSFRRIRVFSNGTRKLWITEMQQSCEHFSMMLEKLFRML